MRHAVALVGAFLSLALTAPAFGQPSVSDDILFADSTAAGLRSRLLVHADSIAAKDGPEASRALAHRGLSFLRDGEPDSAVAMYQRAFELDHDRRYEIADALMLRAAPGDAQRALEVLRPLQSPMPELPDFGSATIQGMFAWAHYLAGRPDSAARFMDPVEKWLSVHSEWRYRLACVALARRDWPRVITLLTPLAVASRNTDIDVMDMLKAAAEELNLGRHVVPLMLQEIAKHDQIENELLAELGARRVSLAGSDGFPLGGVVLTPRAKPRPRAAVVLVEAGDTLAVYDSLAVGMRRMGYAVILLAPRGSWRSVASGCPLASSWRGREAEMQRRCAEDVRAAVAALARETGADTARYLLIGVGSTTPVAVEAARLDRRAGVLILATPAPSPVDRGRMRAGLAALRRPVYFQTGPADYTAWGVLDSLYRACDMRASRVADSDQRGSRATLFRADPRVFERLRLWLEESWPRARAKHATPPSRPRPR